MTEGMIAWSVAVFLLGVLAGGLVWIPYTIREQQREFTKRLELARRYRGLTQHDDPGPLATSDWRGRL